VAGAKLWLESHHHGNQVTSPKYPTKSSAQSASLREKANPVEQIFSDGLLLDLSGDKNAAISWASSLFPTASIRLIDKGELKWESKREALARVRAMKPRAFAVFTSDLQAQSARGSIVLFAALCGARRIVIGDGNGRAITRSRASAFIIEGARLVLEFLFGYLLIVPLSWLLTTALGAALVFRKTVKASRNKSRKSNQERLTAFYIRTTIVPSAPNALASTGGMASHIAGFARGARALGHRLKFISSGKISAIDEVEVKIISPSTALGATRALFEIWNNFVFTAQAISHVQDWQSDDADFIYQRYSRFNWTGVALSIVTGLPLILEFNGSEVWASRNWDPVGQIGLLKRFERLNLRAADFIFVVSDVQRRELLAEGVDARRIVINPNGVDTNEFHPVCGGIEVRRASGIEDKTVVGFVGTFGPWHGAPVLAEAATKVSEAARCHFLFIGDGDQRAASERIIESSAARISTTFTGRIAHNDVAAYLDACDILVSPHVAPSDGSEFFGSPTKLFEYMAMARPVIASRLGQIASVIVDGENGLLVEPDDACALAKAIERLAKDEAMRARLGAAARQTVVDEYTWQHNAARVFDKYKTYNCD
jgi:glycosyltransferase involved in cell wall biosynthesis